MTATGVDLMARWGIPLADTRPTQMSVSWTSKTDDELHSCFLAISFHTYTSEIHGRSVRTVTVPVDTVERLVVISFQATESNLHSGVLQVLVKMFC